MYSTLSSCNLFFSNMHLLDMPLEILRSIVETYIASVEHDCDVTALQLVSSKVSLKPLIIRNIILKNIQSFFAMKL